jgi:hypothetical protein
LSITIDPLPGRPRVIIGSRFRVATAAGGLDDVSRFGRGRTHEQRRRRVAVKTSELGRHVDVDDIAWRELFSRARDSVADEDLDCHR